jgi:two-component system phosphate regulon sensor histidine kinase PhoR
MLQPRYLSVVLSFFISGVTTAFISFLPSSDLTILVISFISCFIFGTILIYFALDYLVFQEVNQLYDRIKQIKKKDFSITPRRQLVEKTNPIELLKKELNTYVTSKEDEVFELKKAAKYRQEFLADVSHELKTPIFAAQGFVHTLLDNPDEEAEIRAKFLEKAAKSLDGLDNLVQDLLTVSQIETGAIKIDKKKMDLRALVEEIFEQVEAKAKKRGVQLKLSAQEGPVYVRADMLRISQVILNLVVNAIKYGNENGTVKVELIEKKKVIQISVIDNGPGIANEHLHRIFERFYRIDKSRAKNSGGTGLGLSIVKHIVQAHNGKITVHSGENKGTTFEFKLEKA